MDFQIAAFLAVDGIANGAIYVLIALGTVLIFSVTRVLFVPFGDIAAFSALTLAMIQLGRLPGTVLLLLLLAFTFALFLCSNTLDHSLIFVAIVGFFVRFVALAHTAHT